MTNMCKRDWQRPFTVAPSYILFYYAKASVTQTLFQAPNLRKFDNSIFSGLMVNVNSMKTVKSLKFAQLMAHAQIAVIQMMIVQKILGVMCEHCYLRSGFLRKETVVVSIVLPFVYHGLAHYAVFLKNSHRKKGINSQMDSEVSEPMVNERQHS